MNYDALSRDKHRRTVAVVTGAMTVGAISATGWLAGNAARDFEQEQAEKHAAEERGPGHPGPRPLRARPRPIRPAGRAAPPAADADPGHHALRVRYAGGAVVNAPPGSDPGPAPAPSPRHRHQRPGTAAGASSGS